MLSKATARKSHNKPKAATIRYGPGESAVVWKPAVHMPVLAQKRKEFPAFWSLSLKQQAFVMNYVGGPTRFNATQSYISAGYAGGKYAASNAWVLKRIPKVATAIQELMTISGLTEDWIKTRVGEIAAGVDIADVESYVKGEKTLCELRNDGVNTLAISKARVTKEKDGSEHRAVEMHDPLPALREAARLAGIGGERSRVDVNITMDFKGYGPEELKRLEHAISGQLDGDIRDAEFTIGGVAGLIEPVADAAAEDAAEGTMGDGES